MPQSVYSITNVQEAKVARRHEHSASETIAIASRHPYLDTHASFLHLHPAPTRSRLTLLSPVTVQLIKPRGPASRPRTAPKHPDPNPHSTDYAQEPSSPYQHKQAAWRVSLCSTQVASIDTQARLPSREHQHLTLMFGTIDDKDAPVSINAE